ncbi:DUF7305 domain-containing protein [Hyalangium minutum]|uniref:Putative lipoprotein n=1 Tax=Hyalangium minutum TaxID=394096 RepID=A0A085WNF6_9BACT|nr:hypothetical protein [Hyalangium minutum]KFE69219.1 putative lipoprotein [Hyalangium minutum]
MRWSHRLLLLALLVEGTSCTVSDTVAVLPESEPEACERGELAGRVFPNALCTCESLTTSAPFLTDGFQSSAGPWVPGGRGASVATNGDLTATEQVQVGGSLSVGGTAAGIQLVARPLSVAGALYSAGPLNGPLASVQVEGPAWIAGDIELAELKVRDALVLPPERNLSVSGTLEVAERRREPVPPRAPPCPCAAGELEDIAAWVRAHITDNDNALLSVDPEALSGFMGARTLQLAKGRFYLRGITGSGTAALVVTGRAALFVEGEVDVESLDVHLEETGELDLFISGSLAVKNRLGLDSPRFPSRLRVYVGGSQPIQEPAQSRVVGHFYAPLAPFNLGTGFELFGSLFARRVDTAGDLSIHYDSDVQGLGNACPGLRTRP